jgi:hypothetical protein
MSFVTKLDMDAVRLEVQDHLRELMRKGYSLPVLENGKIVYLKEDPVIRPSSESVDEMGFAESPADRIDPPKA